MTTKSSYAAAAGNESIECIGQQVCNESNDNVEYESNLNVTSQTHNEKYTEEKRERSNSDLFGLPSYEPFRKTAEDFEFSTPTANAHSPHGNEECSESQGSTSCLIQLNNGYILYLKEVDRLV